MWTEITRRKYEREGPRYASDLTDAEWALIEPHMPPAKRLGRPRDTELRSVLDAICTSRGPAVSGGCCRRTSRRSPRCRAISTTGVKPPLGQGFRGVDRQRQSVGLHDLHTVSHQEIGPTLRATSLK
jgi:putative transposase